MRGVSGVETAAKRCRHGGPWSFFLILILGVSASAQAQEGWYAGIDGGWSRADVPASFWIDTPGTTGEVKNSGFAGQLYAGYQLIPHLNLEVGWTQAADTHFTGQTDGVRSRWVKGDTRGSTTISGLRLSAVGLWPASGPIQVYGKAGLFFFSTSTDYAYTINNINRFNDDGGSGIVSAGVQARLWRGWSLHGEWQYTNVHLEKRANIPVNFLLMGVTHPIP